jgi:hypothetical protein
MEKSENSQDRLRLEIVKEEIERFKKLVEGHKKLLLAIGNL